MMIDMSIMDEKGLEGLLSELTEGTRKVVGGLSGDIVVLGAGGKMGPTLAMMLKKAAPGKTVYAVSRFGDAAVKERLEAAQVQTVTADLLEQGSYAGLPDVPNVYYLVGMKFGSAQNEAMTWALNSFVPGLVAQHYRKARIVVFSTGNVYPCVSNDSGGAREDTPPNPVGEYAQSCLGRERVFQYFSQTNNTPMVIDRINYANEPRYGVIVDMVRSILNDEPIDVSTGAVNLIWQRDANDYIAQSITRADVPAAIINVTRAETYMLRDVAQRIGELLGKKPGFTSTEMPTSFIANASRCAKLFGAPKTTLAEMVEMITRWVAAGKDVLGKPTKFSVRDGKF